MSPLSKLFPKALLTGLLAISAALAPGASIAVPSTTAATEPDLAGVVAHDQLIPFVIKDTVGNVLCAGRLQDRVVRSTKTGLLHFYYRIIGDSTRQPGFIRAVTTRDFDYDTLSTAYRTDGLGTVPPSRASRSASGANITFDFRDPRLSCTAQSRFFLLKTTKEKFGPGGATRITLMTGQSTVLKTVMPLP